MNKIQENINNTTETDLHTVENYTTLIRYTTSVFLQREMKFESSILPHELLFQIFDSYFPYLASKLKKAKSNVLYCELSEFLNLFKGYIVDLNHLSYNSVRAYTNWLITNFGDISELPLEFDTLMDQLLTLELSDRLCDIFDDLLLSVCHL